MCLAVAGEFAVGLQALFLSVLDTDNGREDTT